MRGGDSRDNFDSSQDGTSGSSSSSGDKEYNDDDSDGSEGGLAKNFTSARDFKPKTMAAKDKINGESSKQVKGRIESALKFKIEELIPFFKSSVSVPQRPYCNTVQIKVSMGEILGSDLNRNKNTFTQ